MLPGEANNLRTSPSIGGDLSGHPFGDDVDGPCGHADQLGVGAGAAAGIALYTPVIVKYRDEKTDASVRLEDLLR